MKRKPSPEVERMGSLRVRKQGDKFVMSVPVDWVKRATLLGGKCLAVGLVLVLITVVGKCSLVCYVV